MEKEQRGETERIRLTDAVERLSRGVVLGMPMENIGSLERMKELAYPVIGPLYVGYDPLRHQLVIRRATTRENAITPEKWG